MNYKLNLFKKKVIDRFPFTAKFLKFNYGIDLKDFKAVEEKESHYVFGVYSGLNKKVLMPSGDWRKVAEKIEAERQSGPNIESMNCTVFAALNTIEMIMAHKFGVKQNYSDRFIGILSGTSYNGNLPTRVLDTIRKYGLLPEANLPNNIMRFNWAEYYSLSGINQSMVALQAISKKFLDEYTIGYETVYPSIPAMKEALKFGPLYVVGFAWAKSGDVYYSWGDPNHAFVITSIEQAIAYKNAYDSYDPFFKKLASNYQIYYPKLIVINKRGAEYDYGKLKGLLERGIEFIMRPESRGEIYQVLPSELKYLSTEEWNNLSVKRASDSKILTGVSEEYFNSLLT